MPAVVILAVYAYEMNLCIALFSSPQIGVLVELLAFDVFENLYHLWCFSRYRVESKSDARRQQCIVVTLLLRECVQILAPIQYLVVLTLEYFVRHKFNDAVCRMDHEEFLRAVTYLLVDIAADIVIGVVTSLYLRRQGVSPLTTLRGVLAVDLPLYLSIVALCLLHFHGLQHASMGNDKALQFLWVRNPEARWECGVEWFADKNIVKL